ncbi:MAG: hypothetical protein L3J59_15680 [Methylococcaceae bacterium]|nr:hypothetical protein [Methylococcaceae bacterium]
MNVSDVLIIWEQQKERGFDPTPVSFRIRTSNSEIIAELQREYGANKTTILNDLLALGILQLKSI